ncbi:unnamed protein product [Aphanomyces euteiches]
MSQATSTIWFYTGVAIHCTFIFQFASSTMVKVFASVVAASSLAVQAGTITTFPKEVADLIDTTADPCTDFFQYACGTWYKSAEIPPTQSNTDTSFTLLGGKNEQVIQSILAQNKPKLGEFYASCLDTATLTSLGVMPLSDDIKAIRNATSSEDLVLLSAELSKRGVPAFTTTAIQPDGMDSTVKVLYASQGALTLVRAYYTDSTRWAAIQDDYKNYIKTILVLSGKSEADAAAAAEVVSAFERKMAGVQLTKIELMEVEATNYNPLSFYEANTKYPLTIGSLLKAYGLNVRDGCGLTPSNKVILNDLSYFDRAEGLLKSQAKETLATVLEYKLIHSNAQQLSPDFVTAYWTLFGKKINGETQQPTRQAFCRTAVDTYLGEMVGEYFLQAAFNSTAADASDKMVNQLEKSFRDGLNSADWLDESTRANALTKLSKFTHLIGGPKNPQLYPKVSLDAKSFTKNRQEINGADIQKLVSLIGTPNKKDTFGMTPQTVNAYYTSRDNQIVFPAGILQPPFFRGDYDPAQNFGAIGMVIGHEITHGFDNSGRRFDGDGNQNPWWSPEVSAAFDKKAACISTQYSGFQVFSEFTPGKKIGNVDGTLTLGETIADNGGLKTSFRAYTEYMKTATSPYTKETGEKLFYLAFAQGWCSKNSDKYLEGRLLNVHPPGRFRVYGAIQNNPQFARVFNCPANSTMNPANKCFLWE